MPLYLNKRVWLCVCVSQMDAHTDDTKKMRLALCDDGRGTKI